MKQALNKEPSNELDRFIKAGAITVAKAQLADPPFETVVAAYDVEPGDVEILRLCCKDGC